MPMPQIEEGISNSPILYYKGNLAINLRSRCMYLVTLYYFTYDLLRWFSKFAFRWVGTDWLSDRGHSKLGRKGITSDWLPDGGDQDWFPNEASHRMPPRWGCPKMAHRWGTPDGLWDGVLQNCSKIGYPRLAAKFGELDWCLDGVAQDWY